MAVEFNGTNGATVADEDGWVYASGGTTGQYSTSLKHSGSASAVNTGVLGLYMSRAVGSNTHVGGYFYLTAYASSAGGYSPHVKFLLWGLAGPGYFNGFGVDPTGRLTAVGYSTNSYTTLGSTNEVPLNQWFRLECSLGASSEVRLFKGANLESTTASLTYSSSISMASAALSYDNKIYVGPANADWDAANSRAFGGTVYNTDYLDDVQVSASTWPGPWPAVVTHTADAAASETASATAAATRTRPIAAPATLTATAAANAGMVLTADGTPSITAVGSADVSVITTHDAEAASTITVSTTDSANLTRAMVAASTITATGSATAALDGGADAAVQALGVASIRIDGETSPGFLYATVSKHILTN